MANPSSASPNPSTPASSKPSKQRSSPDYQKISQINPPPKPSPSTPASTASPSSSTAKATRPPSSPALFARLKTQRIAILTYHKHPGEDWQETEFTPHQVTLQNGDTVTLPLAERGTQLGNGLWVREIRRLDEKGHQTSILSTDFRSDIAPAAAAMFAMVASGKFLQIHAPTLRA